jgi:branched-subunit amino acid transport protein
VLLQAVAVLGLLSHHHHALLQFVVGISTLAVVFLAFVRNNRIPEAVTRALQLASITICTAATVPQIVLTFQTGKVGWSWITALLSTTGCLVRVFTTLQLTQDRTALVGYVLGSVTNGILLGQVLWYGRPH